MSKLIKHISEMIDEQLECAEDHTKHAVKYKDEHMGISKVLNDIATDEMRHVNMLHEEVVKAIETHRKTAGEPPASMLAVYDYLHNKQIEKANRVKNYLSQYRGG